MSNGIFTPATNIDDAWDAVDAYPLRPGDPRYVNCDEVRGETQGKIERILRRHARSSRDLHLLFTGYRGNGKTTELFQLHSNIAHEYHVIYFDVAIEMDVNNLALTDLLLAIAKTTVDGMNAAGYALSNKLLKDVGDWFYERVLEKTDEFVAEAGAQAEIGVPAWFSFISSKLFASIKAKTEDREIMRRKFERDITGLLVKVNVLLDEARRVTRDNGKTDLLLIMDSLDRLRVGLDKSLFMGSGAQLRELHCNFIYVVPISLLYDEQASLLPFDERLRLPMIPIYEPGIERRPNEAGIKHLQTIISKRINVEHIFANPEQMIRKLILTSGGHLRDLMKLIAYACNETEDRIGPEHIERAINSLVTDYENLLRDEDYAQAVTTYRTQDPPNNETNQKLIYNNVILVYTNPDHTEWKDVHPAVVLNNKFKKVSSSR